MSLETRITDFVAAVGADVKALTTDKAPKASPALTGNVTLATTSAAALTITNTGTGNSLLTQASGGTFPVSVNAIGQLLIGKVTSAGKGGMHMWTDESSSLRNSQFNLRRFSNVATDGSMGNYQRMRGTIDAPLPVLNGDILGTFAFAGSDSTGTLRTPFVVNAVVDAIPGATFIPTALVFKSMTTDLVTTEKLRIDSSGNVLVTSPGVLGYGTGAGGSVTQATSRATGVTLSKPCGAITLVSDVSAAGQVATFTVTNTLVKSTDVVNLSVKTAAGIYFCTASSVADGSFNVSVYTPNAIVSAEAPVINFAILRAAAA